MIDCIKPNGRGKAWSITDASITDDNLVASVKHSLKRPVKVVIVEVQSLPSGKILVQWCIAIQQTVGVLIHCLTGVLAALPLNF